MLAGLGLPLSPAARLLAEDRNAAGETDTRDQPASVQPRIVDGDGLQVAIEKTDVSCHGAGDGTATAKVVPEDSPVSSYLWDDPLAQSTRTATGLRPGTYRVEVTASDGRTVSASVTVEEPEPLAVTVTTSHASCDGVSVPGSAAAYVTGGTGPYELVWSCCESAASAACNSACAIGIPAGPCTVRIVDANGCSLIEEVVIHPAGPVRLETRATAATCGQGNDGTATALPAGGTPPYSFLWSDPAAQTTATATGLAPGTYAVRVADSSAPDQCSLAASVVVGEPAANAFEVVASADEPAICAGEGTRLRAVLGDAAPEDPRFRWSPARGLSDPAAAEPFARPSVDTTYTVTVTDAAGGGCQGSDSVAVTVVPLPAVRTGADVTVCRDSLPAEVTLSATGAGEGALYFWIPTLGLDDPSSSSPVLSLGADGTTTTFTVTVSENGCASTAWQMVTVGGTEPALEAGTAAVCAGGSVRLVATGGISYAWQGEGSFSCLDCSNPFFQPAGEPGSVSTARVRITDAFGCVVVLEQEVAVTGSLWVAAPDDLVVCPGEPVVLETTASDEIDRPLEYLWSPAAGLSCTRCPSPTATVSRPTTYEVSVFAGGCSAHDRVEIRIDEIFGAGFVAEVAGKPPGRVRFLAEPRDADAIYRWDFGDGDRIAGQGTIAAPGLNQGRTTGSFSQPVHLYQASGRYQVCLTLEKRCGSHTVCELVTVEDVPCETCKEEARR